EPIQEDYGWGVLVTIGHHQFWVDANTFDPECGESNAGWGIAISPHFGLNVVKRLLRRPDRAVFIHLCGRIDDALHRELGILQVEWWAHDFLAGSPSNRPIVV